LEHDKRVLVDPRELLPRVATLGALELWSDCLEALELCLLRVEHTLGALLPHELCLHSHATIHDHLAALTAACGALVAEQALKAADPICAHLAAMVRLAKYSLAASTRDFVQVESVLRSGSGTRQREVERAVANAISSAPTKYAWCRFHLCALQYLQRHPASEAAPTDPPLTLRVDVSAPVESRLSSRWSQLLHMHSSELASTMSPADFPVDPVSTLTAVPDQQSALRAAWALISAPSGEPVAQADGEASGSSFGIWPLERERTGRPEASASHTPLSLTLGSPVTLFNRKGDFVRAACVNALNACQVVVALGRGVEQLELSEALPTDDANEVSGARMDVQQCSASDFTARCLCAHPQLPLYLAGGDSVVQCWQFGQSIQGQGLHDHMRAQYKLPAGGHVANMRICSICSEQFGSIDDDGFLSLWRFQSGADMPLPFSRLQCHTKRGSDLCFVDSSVVLATSGLSHGSVGTSLCLWDVLLPPAQALVASCAAHPDGGRCIAHCTADRSLISGGENGDLAIFDLRQRRIREKWRAHTMAVQALALVQGPWCFSASADADVKLWRLGAPRTPSDDEENFPAQGHWPNAHEAHALLGPLVASKLGRSGVTALEFATRPSSLISGGADGRVKLWSVEY